MGEYSSSMSQVGLIQPKQGIYEESSTPCARLGQVIDVGNRRFVYCKNGATALAAGKLVISPSLDSNVNIASAAVSAIGATTVTATLGSTVVANQFAEGFYCINDGTGEGYTYKIKSHPAASAAATCVFTLYDPIAVATAGTSATEVTIIPNPFYNVIISSATATDNDHPVGVPQIAVTAYYYFWAQFCGICSVLNSGNVTHPGTLYASGAAGALAIDAQDYTETIARSICDCVDGEYNPVILHVPGIA